MCRILRVLAVLESAKRVRHSNQGYVAECHRLEQPTKYRGGSHFAEIGNPKTRGRDLRGCLEMLIFVPAGCRLSLGTEIGISGAALAAGKQGWDVPAPFPGMWVEGKWPASPWPVYEHEVLSHQQHGPDPSPLVLGGAQT